jgi:hypothetical protein
MRAAPPGSSDTLCSEPAGLLPVVKPASTKKQTKHKMKNILIGWLAAQGTALPNDATDQSVMEAVQKAVAKNTAGATALANEKDQAVGKATALENELTTAKTALANEQTARKTERKSRAEMAVDLVIQKGRLAVAGRDAAVIALENAADFDAEFKKLDGAAPVVKTGTDSASTKQAAALNNEADQIAADYKKALENELPKAGQNITEAHRRIMTLPEYSGLAQKLVPKKAA